MQQLQSHPPPPLFCLCFTLLSNPLLQRFSLTHSRLLMSAHVHVRVCLHITEKQPRSVMTPAEAQLIEPGLSALTGWPVKYGHHFNEATVCDSTYRYMCKDQFQYYNAVYSYNVFPPQRRSHTPSHFHPLTHPPRHLSECCRDLGGSKKEREIGLSSVKRLPVRRTTQHLSTTNQHNRTWLNSTRTTPETWRRKRLTLLLCSIVCSLAGFPLGLL